MTWKAFTAQFEEHDRAIFWSLVWSTCAVTALYIFFLGSSVYSVIARKQAEMEGAMLRTRVATLETRFVELDHSIDLAFARDRGFIDIPVPTYVARENSGNGFTLRSTGVR